MAESYSVKAVLSAEDRGFSSMMKGAAGSAGNLKSTLASGLGFGMIMAAGQAAFSAITSGITGVVSELSSSSAAWKTFEGNMSMLGKNSGEIKSTKKELQDFATQTIYSASDMATTFSQLEAVGTKNTTQLVKGFGGLAAAAENPAQAMKTLSTQATQMSAKPKVAWMDFKLMLEQTPAGMAAVAKEMGMSTSELVSKVQDGTVATEDFFDAIAKVGTNDAFTKLATEYKTVDQAMGGLKETLGTKLGPAFDVLSDKAISGISGIIDKLGDIDGDAVAAKVTSAIDTISPYLDKIKTEAGEIWNAFGEAFSAIADEVQKLTGSFGSTDSISSFGDAIGIAGDAVKKFAGFLREHADIIAKVITHLPQLLAAYAGFKILKSITPLAKGFTTAIGGLASKGISTIAGKLTTTAAAQKSVGGASASSAGQVLSAAVAFIALGAGVALACLGLSMLASAVVGLAAAGPLAIGVMIGLVAAIAGLALGASIIGPALTAGASGFVAFGAGILLVAAGFALLVFSATSLASAGPLAIGVMVGLVAAIALLTIGAALLGPALTVGAVGFIAFGAAIVLVGVGALLAATALTLVASVLPTIIQYGASGAVAIAQLSLGMIAFAAGAALAGVGCIVLGAGLAVVAVGLALVGAAVLITAAGVLVLAAGVVVLGAGMMITAAALTLAVAVLPGVAIGALAGAAAFTLMLAMSLALTASLTLLNVPLLLLGVTFLATAVSAVAFALAMTTGAVGVFAMAAALLAVNSNMKSIASNAKSAKNSITSMVSSVDVVNSGLDALGSKAKSAVNSVVNAFSSGASKARASGTAMADGIKSGIQSGLVPLPPLASSTMAAFNSALSSGGNVAVATSRSMSSAIVSALRSASSGSYSSGYNIGIGLANGMRACLGTVRSVAAQLASAAEAAIRAKAKIHSPSKVSTKLGGFWGEGYAGGIADKAKEVWRQAENLIQIPSIVSAQSPDVAYAGGGSANLSEDYKYSNNATYTIIVPVQYEGRELARVTAQYTQEELEKQEMRSKRKRGCK